MRASDDTGSARGVPVRGDQLALGKNLFDWVPMGRICGQDHKLSAWRGDGLTHAGEVAGNDTRADAAGLLVGFMRRGDCAMINASRYGRGKLMQLHAEYVAVSVVGDDYQLLFEAEADSDDPESRYLISQCQFEVEDFGRCSIESHDANLIGEFILAQAELSQERLSVSLDRSDDKENVVTLGLGQLEFEKVSQVLKIISGEISQAD